MNWFLERIRGFGDKKAISYKDRDFSYGELFDEIENFKKILASQEVQPGEVVAILSDYNFRSIALFLSLMENKNIIVPITTKVKQEIDERVREAFADKIISLDDENFEVATTACNSERHSIIKTLQQNKNSGLVLFSSGTSGKPKAIAHNLNNLVDTYKNRKPRGIIFLIFLMFDHIGGLNTLLNVLSMGATLLIPENRDANHICNLIERHRINILPASPTFLNLVLISEAYRNYNLDSLIMITYGTEPMPESLLKRLKSVFPKVKFLQTFGTSETGILQTSSKSSTSTFLRIDDPNVEFKIVNSELWLRSRTQTVGYLNCTMESFTEDGWFKTGDLVETSENGYINIIGRSKEVINVGGLKVLPVEVESVILQIPQIIDCMVYGEKNAITGQSVSADVVLKEGIDDFNAKKEIRRFCKDKLDDYKIPVKVNVVDRTNFGDRFKKVRCR